MNKKISIIAIICILAIAIGYYIGTDDTQTDIPANTNLTLKPIKLPKPKTDGGMPLMEALKNRQTIRNLSTEKIPEQILSNLIWAAFGINRPEKGNRTAPSAVNWQEIDIYVALEKGLYIYEPKAHILNPVMEMDLREKTTQMFQPSRGMVSNAPVTFIYVADFDRIDGIGRFLNDEEKTLTARADSGFIAQNVYLFCASEGLGTVIRAMVSRDKLKKTMRLRPSQNITLCQTIGFPNKGAVIKSKIDLSNIPDGTYQGSASDKKHDYTAKIIIKNHRLVDVEMTKYGNTKYEQKAKGIINKVINEQSFEVDAISGATNSSQIILKAIANAVELAEK